MKIQPIDVNVLPEEREPEKFELKPVVKSRFKRLFERQLSSVLRVSAPGKLPSAYELPNHCNNDGSEELEPSSMCLAQMVRNFIEENNEKPKCSRSRCNCFSGNSKDGIDYGQDSSNSPSSTDVCETIKSLVLSVSVPEKNLLADIARIAEKNKICKRKEGQFKKFVTDGLKGFGYNASICKSKWEKFPNFPAGEYEYIDVLIESERFLVDIDFISEFEIARSTKAYKLVLQTLPQIFVGKSDRLEKIVHIVSEAAEQSLKKRGMPFPPWRKADYVKSKWLSPYIRLDLLGKKNADKGDSLTIPREAGDGESIILPPTPWAPPEVKPRKLHREGKMVTGLASLIENKP